MNSLTLLRYNRKIVVEDILENIQNDIYFLMLCELKRRGYLQEVFIVYFSDRNTVEVLKGVQILFIKKDADLNPQALRTSLLWVRGDKKEYLGIISKGTWGKRFFYGASSHYYPYTTWGFDGVLTDEMEHYSLIEKLKNNPIALIFLKPANESIFRKLHDVEKIYDVCVFSSVHKNPSAFINLYNALPNLNYVIIGRDDDPALEHLKHKENINFTGFISHESANENLNQSRIGVVLSIRDGAPRVIIESMAAGLPQIVNTRLSSGRSYINDETGLVVDDKNLSEKVEILISRREEMSPETYYANNFSLKIATDRLITNLDRIASLPEHTVLFRLKVKVYNFSIIAKIRKHYLKRYCQNRFFGD